MSEAAIYRRTLEGFVPANGVAQEFFAKAKLGELVTLKGVKTRGLKFHRLYFAILRLISENSDPHITEEQALYLAKVGAGCGQWMNTGRKELFVPGSISFAAMDGAAFDEFVKASIPPLVSRFMAGTAPEAVIREALEVAA
jgi:hypothetical protein